MNNNNFVKRRFSTSDNVESLNTSALPAGTLSSLPSFSPSFSTVPQSPVPLNVPNCKYAATLLLTSRSIASPVALNNPGFNDNEKRWESWRRSEEGLEQLARGEVLDQATSSERESEAH